jgi:hypothetical protein
MRNGHIALQIRPGLHLGFSRIDVFDARTHQVFSAQSALCELGGSVTRAELVERSHMDTRLLKVKLLQRYQPIN